MPKLVMLLRGPRSRAANIQAVVLVRRRCRTDHHDAVIHVGNDVGVDL